MTDLSMIPWLDLLSVLYFAACWTGYRMLVREAMRKGRGLTARMHHAREAWLEEMSRREVRIVDTAIMGSLQNGTAFFASTSLIAIGGAMTLLRATDDVLRLFSDLPLGPSVTRSLWEVKSIGLAFIFGYAFFKFAWSYRLFNYSAILIGATPPATSPGAEKRQRAAVRAAKMTIAAGSNFAAGQRTFFISFAYLGWFMGPLVFVATTTLIFAVLWARQFRSQALEALLPSEEDIGAGPPPA